MVKTVKINLDELDLEDFSLPREAESWGSCTDSGEFSVSYGEVPLNYEDIQLAKSTSEGFHPPFSSAHLHSRNYR